MNTPELPADAQGRRPFVISREFNAPRETVWRVWTEREHLMQWFGARGCTMSSATLDFRVGGKFHYCMSTPDGKTMWGRFLYREIMRPEKLVWLNSFSDPEGGVTRHPFTSDPWPLLLLTEAAFKEQSGKTTVTITWLPFEATPEEWRTFEGGRDSMQMGWTGTLDRHEAYLKTQV